MEKHVFLGVPKHAVSLAAILITFFFSIATVTTDSNDDSLYSRKSQYLSSESQDDVPKDDNQAPFRAIGVTIFPGLPERQLSLDYLLEGELRLRLSSLVIPSRHNRAPPPLYNRQHGQRGRS